MFRIAVCVVVLFVAAGCGAARADKMDERPATSKPTTFVSVEPPQMPPAAKRMSPSGAVEFTSYFLAIRNYAIRTGRTDQLRKLTAPECLMCLTIPTLIESTYRAGGRIDGGLWRRTTRVYLETNYPDGQVPTDRGFLMTNIRLTPMRVLTKDGQTIGTYPGSVHDRGLSISIDWRDGHWLVEQIMTIGNQQL